MSLASWPLDLVKNTRASRLFDMLGCSLQMLCSRGRRLRLGIFGRVSGTQVTSYMPLNPRTVPTKPPTGIQDMPPEIMLTIFESVQLQHEPDDTLDVWSRNSWSRVDRAFAIIQLSHVCRYWRNIALEYSGFWTRVEGHNIEQLFTFIARSKSRPLSLFMTTDSDHFLDVIDCYGSRIERLDVTMYEEADGLRSLEDFVETASLRCLTFNHERAGNVLRHNSEFFLLGKHTLFIKALSIVPFSGHFPSTRFPDLTHLYLSLRLPCDETGLPLPHSSTFFCFLRNTPKLEFMTLYGVEGTVHDFSPKELIDAHAPVPLPNLRSLLLVFSSLTNTVMILQRLELPETAFIRLHSLYATSAQAPALPPLGVVKSIDRLSLVTKSARLHMIAEGPSSRLWLDGLMTRRGDPDEGDDGDNDDDANDDANDKRNWRDWLTGLPSFLPLVQITRLDFCVGAQHSVISGILPHTLGLTELSMRLDHRSERLGKDPAFSLARAIYLQLSKTEPLICPALQTLRMDVKGSSPGAIPNLYPAELRNMILIRRHVGHPIHHVVIQPFPDEDVVCNELLDITERFDTIKSDTNCVQLCSPGLAALAPYDRDEWHRWYIDGADMFWPHDTLEELTQGFSWVY